MAENDDATLVWWCLRCGRVIPAEHVTRGNHHAPVAGGCGMGVVRIPRDKVPPLPPDGDAA